VYDGPGPHAALLSTFHALLGATLIGFALAVALAGFAGTAAACNGPGGTCGVIGGSCCSGSTCVVGFCVADTCQGEGDLCTSSSQCCGSRVCNLGFCRTPVGLGEACGPAAPCKSGLTCDPLSGFVCVGSAGANQACGPLVHCQSGLQCTLALLCSHDPALDGETCDITTPCGDGLFCAPGLPQRCTPTAGLGDACGPALPCSSGLVCDPLSGFVCVGAAGANEACGPLVPCQDGLVCTAGLTCSHRPARVGESCDVVNGCEADAYCRPDTTGIAGVLLGHCSAYRVIGESCALPITDPDGLGPRCKPGTSCEPCPLESCDAPTQCFRNGNKGLISETECRTLYSPALRQDAIDLGVARTYGGGESTAAVAAASSEFGAAYGPDGSYGCYTTVCYGVDADIAQEVFAGLGFYTSFDAIAGSSFANVQEAQTPLSLLNFSTAQIYARDPGNPVPNPELIGTEDAFAVGAGASPIPWSAGSLDCETTVDPIALSTNGGGPVPEPDAGALGVAAAAALGGLARRRIRASRRGRA
jgi:hypothetical protein